MQRPSNLFARRYRASLLTYLRQKRQTGPEAAHGLGGQATAAGLQMLDLAKLHERILVGKVLMDRPPRTRAAFIRRAAAFFAAAAAAPSERGTGDPGRTAGRHQESIETLSRHSVELAASNLELNQEIAQRKAAEDLLRKSERRCLLLLARSDRQQRQLRGLSRRIISAQEDERRRISRELHDVIAQTLTGISLHLASLTKEAEINTAHLGRNIANTQRLVGESVEIVHQFARELRPAVLDDLGLIPALRSYIKDFAARTGIPTRLSAFATAERLNPAQRTALFRVAQEALTNAARHARAECITVDVAKTSAGVRLVVHDDGKDFAAQRALLAPGRKGLGLIGMRERMEMLGGGFAIASSPGAGTSITASIPLAPAAPRRAGAATRSRP